MDARHEETCVLSPFELEALVDRMRGGVDQGELAYWMDRFAAALEAGHDPTRDVMLVAARRESQLTLHRGRAMALAALKLQISLPARVIEPVTSPTPQLSARGVVTASSRSC